MISCEQANEAISKIERIELLLVELDYSVDPGNVKFMIYDELDDLKDMIKNNE